LPRNSIATRVASQIMYIANCYVSIFNTKSSAVLSFGRFLRKEKELVEARFELLQSETTRLRQQNNNLKRQADLAEKTLAEEQENAKVFILVL
jgi:hypothetical protein